jgi:hypothetical protein
MLTIQYTQNTNMLDNLGALVTADSSIALARP